ncbi:MAG: peptide chain release factor N(5)-glutamine methyltransferase [Armatimonadota bacterium]|nr:peptide chain release factor N(5)-glutamine methyltransferase [Armatimonadota bacterium]MDR5696096.1 peptide chain release factor N(5)-glutamine methyltransferase [Armatimonadota bacterium]
MTGRRPQPPIGARAVPSDPPTGKDIRPVSFREAYLFGREHLAAAGVESAPIEAEVLLRHAARLDRAGLYVRWTQPVSEAVWRRYVDLLEGRAAGRPTAYLVGEREFCGLGFAVDERVLIPRPETELLVDVALEAIRGIAAPVVVDVGTGSGAVAVVLAVRRPDLRAYATDVSRAALEVASGNARRHGVASRVTLLAGHALVPVIERGVRAHAVLANPPYVPRHARDELPAEIRDHEPPVALLSEGPRGTEIHERIAFQAPRVLLPGGTLAMEVAAKWHQAQAVAELFEGLGFEHVRILRDLAGLERVVVGTWAIGRPTSDRSPTPTP